MNLKQYLREAMQVPSEHQTRARELWPNARFDMMGQLIIRGDFVLQVRTNFSAVDRACRILKVVGTTPRRLVCVEDTDRPNDTCTINPETCLVITQQIGHTLAHPVSIPGVV